jgi:predicted nucleic acid-binding Zn ribbon protein
MNKNIENFKQEAIIKGLIFVGDSPKPKHYLYKFEKCGHKREMIPTKVRNGNPSCKECDLKRFKKEALKKGLRLIPKITKPKHYKYEFIACGHTKEYEPRTVRVKNPICNICLKERLKKEALKKGLELIEDSERRGYYIYKFIECGHIKESRPDMINSGQPCCEKCGETYHAKESNVYLIKIFKNGRALLKLGVANNSKQRIKTYKLKNNYKAQLLIEKPFETNFEAVKFEKAIHKRFKEYNLNPENMKKVMESGFTECYPMKVLKKLKQEIVK